MYEASTLLLLLTLLLNASACVWLLVQRQATPTQALGWRKVQRVVIGVGLLVPLLVLLVMTFTGAGYGPLIWLFQAGLWVPLMFTSLVAWALGRPNPPAPGRDKGRDKGQGQVQSKD